MDLDKQSTRWRQRFVLSHEQSEVGSQTIGFMADEAKASARDPMATLAASLGWQSVEYIVRCGEKNGTGK